MTPSDETIAAVLALPLEARRLLATEAEGPGWWVCFDAGHYYAHQVASSDGRDVHPLSAWLPCAPTEILRVWAKTQHDETWVLDDEAAYLGEPGWSVAAMPPIAYANHDGTLDGMLRAAVGCWPG